MLTLRPTDQVVSTVDLKRPMKANYMKHFCINLFVEQSFGNF